MKKKNLLNKEDIQLFRESVTGTRRIVHDTVLHLPKRKKVIQVAPERLMQEQVDASYYFSDEFQPNLDTEGATRYVREGSNHYELEN